MKAAGRKTLYNTEIHDPAPLDSDEEVRRLKERIEILESVVENFPGGISVFDSSLQMVLCNAQQVDMLDYPEALVTGGLPKMEQLFRFNASRGEYGPGDVETIVKERMELVEKQISHRYDRQRPNGTVLEIQGEPLRGGGFLTAYFDVTDIRRNQDMVAHMALHDPLTGLPNRTKFSDRLEAAVALAARGVGMAAHFLDLDRFKLINDGLGHQAGDHLLKLAAERLQTAVRDCDTVARIGGDEFAIVQTQVKSQEDAEVLARRILDRISEPYHIGDDVVTIGCSIGIAIAPQHGTKPDKLISRADTALYRSKDGGRNRFTFFHNEDETWDAAS
ncbi:diguanylate cyclase domain-containing protein [Amaricoccus tamworthensis]|uniref:diguanylate cyclase domain-containing protein n=1 Tax=Amaricoccus tamworthensis TaxID=57002 RepID=UPI003C7E927F